VAPEFTRIGARVYFMVPDRWGGASLWRSDGSTAGTERVPPPVVGEFEQWRRTFAGLGGSVLLFTSSSNGFDLRLWSGDGSGTDWTQLRDFGAGSQLGEVVRRDDEVLFVVREGGGGGLGLYRTDGTAAGTRETLDFAALGVDEVRSVHAVGARLFFAAGPQVGRTELWVSDGTPATTRRLQEIAPGESGSEPRGFALAGSRLYFSADDGLHGRELWSLPLDRLEAPCQPSATALCLGDGRFRAELFRHDRAGERGDGRAVPWSSASGAFWFYDYGNPEAAVKVVDGGAVNGRYWLFFGPLGDAYVALTVTDLETGEVRRYPAEPGPLAAFADLAAFPSATAAPAGEPASAEFASIAEGAFAELERAAEGPPSSIAAPAVSAGAAGACAPGSTRLCLQDGRFAVGLLWRDGSGVEHQAFAFAHGDRAGYFAFYGARDLQAALKILDGRAINGRFWLFATSLTHLGYTLTVTDSETGAVYDYPKPAGGFASVIDLTSLR
jgi:ELWxxDGT repeat protein